MLYNTVMGNITVKKLINDLGSRHLASLLFSLILTAGVIIVVGNMIYDAKSEELHMRNEMDVIRSAEKVNAYLADDRDALNVAGYTVNSMLVDDASNEEILEYLTDQSESMINTLDATFTGMYGLINNEYMDGAGWVPDKDFVPTERPWYKAAIAQPHETVFVDPYLDLQTGNVMMTVAELLDDGHSVIALDIGLDGLQEITDEIASETPGTMLMLTDRSNVVAAHSDRSEVGKEYSLQGDSLGSMILREINDQPMAQFTIDYDGRSYLVNSKKVEGGWQCISTIDTELFYSPLRKVLIPTIVSGILAMLAVFALFLSISLRDIRTRNLNIQIQAAADIYDTLTDIDLTDDSYYELNGIEDENYETDIGKLHSGAQDMLYERVEARVDEGAKPYVREFLNLATLNARLGERGVLTVEYLNGENKWCRGRFICAERDKTGAVTRVLWGVEIIDDEKREQEKLRHLAETDLLTGILNRITGENRIREHLHDGRGGMFVLFDIDHFKEFNDTYGHNIGDQVLISVANCLRNAFRGDDIVMRLGGDEFSAFAPGVYTSEVGQRILDRFYDNLDNVVIRVPHRIQGDDAEQKDQGSDVNGKDDIETVKITVSAGVSFCEDGIEKSFLELYESADACMYESKRTADSRITYSV